MEGKRATFFTRCVQIYRLEEVVHGLPHWDWSFTWLEVGEQVAGENGEPLSFPDTVEAMKAEYHSRPEDIYDLLKNWVELYLDGPLEEE